MNIDEIRTIEKEMRKIIPIYLEELVDYVHVEKRRYLKDEINLRTIIRFDNGLGVWCEENNIYFAIQNSGIFKRMSRDENYGQKIGTKLIDEEEFIENDKDYIDYMDYACANGLKEVDFCLDLLPHAVMHLVGSSEGILGEGITELRTRQICKKYGIRCAPVWHSKETKLVMMLEKYVGEMMLNEASFLHEFSVLLDKCIEIFGPEFKEAYDDLYIEYRTYQINRTLDPMEHYRNYRELNFDRIYEIIRAKEKIEV